MKNLKTALEKKFGQIAISVYRHPWLGIAFTVIVCASLASQLPQLRTDTRNETFFHKDDKVLIDYNNFRDQYGKDEFIILAIDTPEIFTIDFLNTLKNFHKELEKKLPYLDEITSLINIRDTYGIADELRVEGFLEKWPQNDKELELRKKRAMENSLYPNFILSKDLTTTAIIIKPLACNPENKELLQTEGSCEPMSNEQNRALMAAMEEVIFNYESDSFPIAVSGMPAVVDYLNVTIANDLSKIVPFVYLMVIIILALMFRRISGVVYPVLIYIISLTSAFAIMAVLNIPVTNITIILPSYMLVVSISDAIHILALFYPLYHQSKDKEQAIKAAMEHSGLAVLMTTVTTAIGLLSFAAAKVAPVAALGIVAPLGAFLALFYTLILLPALLAIFPVKTKPTKTGSLRFDAFFQFIADLSCNRRKLVFVIFALIFIVAGTGIPKLQFSHLALRWFQKTSAIRVDTEAIDKKMEGTVSLDVVIDTGKPDGLYDTDFIKILSEASDKYATYRYKDLFVGKVLDITTVLKETNRALHANASDKYVVPEDPDLIAQELFLFQLSGSDDLDELVDQQFSQARFALHLPYRDSAKFKELAIMIEKDLKKRFPHANISVTGVNALFIEMLNNVMDTMMKSYTIALVCISILMIVMLGRIRMGLLSMIPNLFPIWVIMGLMGWCGIALDFGTILVGSVAIGIIVDDTIHFLHNFSKYFRQYNDTEQATRQSLLTVGRAMLVTSVVLAGGFLCNMLSGLTINQYTGFLIASTIIIALLTDFLLMPAVLSVVYGQKKILNKQ